MSNQTSTKNPSIVAYVLRLSLTLLIITGVVAALLSGVNALTKDRIAQINAEKTTKAIAAVLSDADQAVAAEVTDGAAGVLAVYESPTGYAVQVAPSGFDGEISMMVGVSKDGTVLGISIISHTETAGLGAVAAANNSKGQQFRSQFEGLSGSVAVSKDDPASTVDALTGATITSRAVCDGVNTALEYVKNLG